MKALDKLRAFAADPLLGVVSQGQHAETINAIADAIETEYQKAEDEWKAENGQMWLKGYSECRAELMEGDKAVAADLEKAGWVRWPLDADGEPWHIGDEIANEHNYHLTVSEITYKGNGCWMLHAEPNWSFYANIARHHHEPTVEDVLFDALKRFGAVEERTAWVDEWLAEYAAKLRALAGEDE